MPKDWKVGIVIGFIFIAIAIIFLGINPRQSNKTASLDKSSEAVSYDTSIGNKDATPGLNSNTLSNTLTSPASPIKLTSSQDEQNPIGSEQSTEQLKIYTVKKGDTLSSISENLYGDKGMWYKIRDANKIENVNSLSAGMKLIIP